MYYRGYYLYGIHCKFCFKDHRHQHQHAVYIQVIGGSKSGKSKLIKELLAIAKQPIEPEALHSTG